MEQITLDLIPKGSLPVLHASQYDDGRQWQVNLKENGEDYTLTNETIVLGVRKGDGCAVTCAVAIESGKKYVILTSTEQMCAVAGQNLAELQITKDNTKIGTLNFILQVERDPLAAGISSGTEIHDLQHQVDECVHTAFETIGASGLPYDNTESGLTADNVQQAIDEVNEKASSLPSYVYTKEETDALLADKADKATLEADYYDRAETDALLADKADASALGDYYTKSETNTKLSGKADKGSVYTTAQVNTLLGDKADKSDLDNYYTKSQTNSLLNDKANKANVYDKNYLNGIFDQIDNAFTDVNTALGQKANSSDVYNKAYIDTALSAKANANAVYTKAETDAKVAGLIEDETTASNKTWSSNKISAELAALLPVDEASGAVANFKTDVALPLIDVKAEIKATGGGGTPSNPIALGGFTGCHINYVDMNQNVQDGDFESTTNWIGVSGSIAATDNVLSYTVTTVSSGNVNRVASTGQLTYSLPMVLDNVYYITFDIKTPYNQQASFQSYISNPIGTGNNGIRTSAFNTVANKWTRYAQIKKAEGTGLGDIRLGIHSVASTAVGDISYLKNVNVINLTKLLGSTTADYLYSLSNNGMDIVKSLLYKNYYAYTAGGSLVSLASVNNDDTPNAYISWQTEAGEVFGGEIDIKRGKLKVYPYYPSYNGETLSGKWLSSMDTYAAGTTPTVGAEVVDLSGAVYTEIDITPQEITPLVGINNLWSDTNGDTTVDYKIGIQAYIDKKIAEVQALVL